MPDIVNVTEDFQRYRLSLRDVWNSFFWCDSALRGWDLVESFDRLRPLLHEHMLNAKLRMKLDLDERSAVTVLVLPNVTSVEGHLGAPLRISEMMKGAGGRNWDQPPSYVRRADMVLTYRDFFDWGTCSYRDLRYALVEITASIRYPDLVGRDALIEVDHAEAFAVPTAGIDKAIAAVLSADLQSSSM